MRRAGSAVALACALGVVAAAPALAVENPSARFYAADGTDDEYGGPGLSWSGPADYGPGRSGAPGDAAFALDGHGRLTADDPGEGNFGTRPFTMRFSARFPDAGDGDEQVLSKRATCRAGSFLDVRTRDGQVLAQLRGPGNRGVDVLHPADVHDGAWHVITLSRTGSTLSLTVDGDAVRGRSDGVVDLDTTAPLRLGDGPCVGDGVTRAEMLLDDVSYGPGPLPTERPLVPGLPLGPQRVHLLAIAGLAAFGLARYRPRVLVLNAGTTPTVGPLSQQTWDSFSSNWDVDVRHVFQFVREALVRPLDPGSTVISLSSGAAVRGSPLSGGYAGAKATIRFISAYAGMEAQQHALAIRFVSVLPQITPATGVGSPFVAAYARSSGLSQADYLARLGTPLSIDRVATMLVDLAANDDYSAPAYLLTGQGLRPVEWASAHDRD
jgi:hypothetical protein